MKKYISIFLCLMMILTFAACSRTQPLEQESGSNSDTSESSEALPATVSVTFPEGLTLVQIAEKLEENHVCSASEFVTAAQDVQYFNDNYGYDFLESVDTKKTAFHLEGYLFPDTYEFYTGENPQKAVNRFLANFNSKFDEDLKAKAQTMGFSVNEVVTLASIIQDECSFEAEMNNVSSVFVNRLNSPSYGKLQSDVTINYVNNYIKDSKYGEFDMDLMSERYNTYKCEGLPVGPVCCPGLAALKAAVNPVQTSYYFFVTDVDMNYYYAETYEKHMENCTKCGIY